MRRLLVVSWCLLAWPLAAAAEPAAPGAVIEHLIAAEASAPAAPGPQALPVACASGRCDLSAGPRPALRRHGRPIRRGLARALGWLRPRLFGRCR